MSVQELSPRQRLILKLVVNGLTNAQVARTLALSTSTVKAELHGLMKTWGCRNRTELAVKASRNGISPYGQPLPPPRRSHQVVSQPRPFGHRGEDIRVGAAVRDIPAAGQIAQRAGRPPATHHAHGKTSETNHAANRL